MNDKQLEDCGLVCRPSATHASIRELMDIARGQFPETVFRNLFLYCREDDGINPGFYFLTGIGAVSDDCIHNNFQFIIDRCAREFPHRSFEDIRIIWNFSKFALR